MNIIKKIKLIINEEDKVKRAEKYKFIRDSQYAQYQGLNLAMSYIMTQYYSLDKNIASEDFKEHMKGLTNSATFFNDINFGQGIDSKSSITQKVKKDFSAALKNGLAKGERSSNNYKKNFPLMTRGRNLNFNYDVNGLDILINWVNKIQFKCVLGNHKNALELQHTLHKVINNEYKVGQSSLYFNSKKELILILTLNIEDKKNNEREIERGRTLGVDLGISIPVYMALSDKNYIRKGLGSSDEFAKQRTQYRNHKRRIQKQLIAVKGGKGRSHKLKSLKQFKAKEKNFAKNYNHFLSKAIVKFASENNCEFINIEKINSDNLDSKILSIWSYYDLESKIEYKAKMVGIKVRFINPAFTSQTCNKCGHVDKENRKTQSIFICKECGLKINADYNAAINISKSTNFIK